MRPVAPRPLEPPDDLVGFSCGRADRDDWLIKRALVAQRAHVARTYVVVDADRSPPAVVGYYTISTSILEPVPASPASAGSGVGVSPPPVVRAVVLERLAVDRRTQGQGLGRALLRDAVLRAERVARRTGARVLLVRAPDDDAVRFLRLAGLRPLPGHPALLYHRL